MTFLLLPDDDAPRDLLGAERITIRLGFVAISGLSALLWLAIIGAVEWIIS